MEKYHFQPIRNSNRLSDDICALNHKQQESQKPLKYMTRSFANFNDRQNFSGLYFHDGPGTPSGIVDQESILKNGQINTTLNLPQSLPPLPLPTTGSRAGGFGNGDINIESQLRGKDSSHFKPCGDRDGKFYERHFPIFDTLPKRPQVLKHTVQKNHEYRGGVSTRK